MTMRAMVVDSPFWTRVLEADMVFRGSVGDGCDGYGHSRSCVDLMSEETSSLSSKTDTEEKAEMTTAAQSLVVSRRDMATQMSPKETSPNNHQSPHELNDSNIGYVCD